MAHEVGAVTGACLLTRRETWDALGGLDEELAVAFNDIDYCLRVRHEAEQRILWTPQALLYHHESVSRGAEDDPVKVARFNAEVQTVMARWENRLAEDPAYSPNLSLDADSFTLARAPRVEPPWQDDGE
jgi:GT2 family glycosyltransferase